MFFPDIYEEENNFFDSILVLVDLSGQNFSIDEIDEQKEFSVFNVKDGENKTIKAIVVTYDIPSMQLSAQIEISEKDKTYSTTTCISGLPEDYMKILTRVSTWVAKI